MIKTTLKMMKKMTSLLISNEVVTFFIFVVVFVVALFGNFDNSNMLWLCRIIFPAVILI